ncbi:TetR/AcrR family transcriptional regulator [Variovorax sp. GT1P44]|uniref:TetR/AcrR family transcriptional regulator n=1 Tax=Variovorax sp. GT1P44 TaxID=3443742 RepID=UPI003F465668
MKLKAEFTQAALEAFTEGGLEAVSIRVVAERVGVSLMTPYRYFESKSALLASLWEHVLHGLYDAMKNAAESAASGRARVAATTDAFLTFWETHPDEYLLVHQTQKHAAHRTERPGAEQAPVYAQLLALLRRNTAEFAAELGTGLKHAKLADDVSVTMMYGYLNASLLNRRYPWGDMVTLRATVIRQIVAAVEQCLLEGPARSPKK